MAKRVGTFKERMKNPPKQERIGPHYVCGCGGDTWILCKNGDCICSQCLCAQARIIVNELAPVTAQRATANDTGPLKLDTDKQVFFYEQDHYYLSNFSAFRIRLLVNDGSGGEIHGSFDTSEAAYHWFKFPGQPELQARIRAAQSAHDAFKLAEHHRPLRRLDWDVIKLGVMREILRAKVEQHDYVRRKLLQTGDRELIENSWRDDYWGWGEKRDGLNMLGKLWMEIRAELRATTEAKSGDAP